MVVIFIKCRRYDTITLVNKVYTLNCVGKTNFILFWGVCNLVNTQCGPINFEFTFEFS